MRKSKLESYEAILEVLVNKPLTIDHMAYAINMDCTILRQHLDFLIKNSLVEERGLGKRTIYAVTEKGVRVLKILNFQKYFGRITNKIRMLDEALQVIRRLKKVDQKKKTER